MARRLALLASAAALVACAAPDSGRAAIFFLFDPTSALPGDTVTVRLGGTPNGFTYAQAVRPFQRPIRVYLVPNGQASAVRTRFDRRLHFVGSLVPDARVHGTLRFTVPPLDAGAYAVAAWCPACARFSAGRTFFTVPVGSGPAPRYRPQMLLAVRPLSFAAGCPATIPNGSGPPGIHHPYFHGNGLLWAGFPPNESVGVLQEDGSYFNKFVWWTSIQSASLTASGVRLDATAPPAELKGSHSSGNTWATAVLFPGAGCWRLTARVGDVSLSVVVRVGPP